MDISQLDDDDERAQAGRFETLTAIHCIMMAAAWGVGLPSLLCVVRWTKMQDNIDGGNRWERYGFPTMRYGGYTIAMLTLIGTVLIVARNGKYMDSQTHSILGWFLVAFTAIQVISTYLRPAATPTPVNSSVPAKSCTSTRAIIQYIQHADHHEHWAISHRFIGLLLLLLTFIFMLGGVVLIVDLFDYTPWVVVNLVINAMGLVPLTFYLALLLTKTVRLVRHGPDQKHPHPGAVSQCSTTSEPTSNVLKVSLI
eukprot:m.89606 g.89606  ORF g.89606 m.89606 type:complete len:254 (-) comp16448_c0_seq1:247-1008(-)